jgi:hypothetical protein
MNARQRFLETLRGGKPDHPPLFMEGIRDEVLDAWRQQGLPPGARLEDLFHYDAFEEINPDVYPLPEIAGWTDKPAVLRMLRQRLDPDDHRRLPDGWKEDVARWKNRDFPLMLRIHQGLLLSLGVDGWNRFSDAVLLLKDDPAFVREVLAIQAGFAARLAERIFSEVGVDAVIFSEPIAGGSGALISPRMYREFALQSYAPVFEVLERNRVPAVIWRSYANPGVLVGEAARSRFNAVWLCETGNRLDYPSLRLSFPALAMIGGIDASVLYRRRAEIHKAVEGILPLVRQGGLIPLLDGRVREDVPFPAYRYYRELLENLFSPV